MNWERVKIYLPYAINFSVCENIPMKNSNSETVYVAQWYNVSMFSNSEKMLRHLLKGKKVFVSGNLRFSEFRNEKTGQVIKTNEIIADFLEPVEWIKSEQKMLQSVETEPYSEDPFS